MLHWRLSRRLHNASSDRVHGHAGPFNLSIRSLWSYVAFLSSHTYAICIIDTQSFRAVAYISPATHLLDLDILSQGNPLFVLDYPSLLPSYSLLSSPKPRKLRRGLRFLSSPASYTLLRLSCGSSFNHVVASGSQLEMTG